MAAIRRTLSPVPRPGALQNGEACSVASPLSKSSSSSRHYPHCGGLLSSLFGSSDSQAFVLSVLSPRSSRPPDRSKPKAQTWRRFLFHFLICFMAGIFMGLAPFASMNLSLNLVSKHQTFSFERSFSTLLCLQNNSSIIQQDNMTRTTMQLGSGDMKHTEATLKSGLEDPELMNDIHENKHAIQPLNEDPNLVSQKLLIIVTPTYARPFQTYYLLRLAQILKLVPPPLLWIVVELTSQSAETADILRRSGVMYRHLVCSKNITDIKDVNVHQRNVALSHIGTHRLDGIVYFADDDYIYLGDLFEQIRKIRRFGTWMVAKLTANRSKVVLEGPVCNGTQVIGWHIDEANGKFGRFPAEMAGFAFNSTILWDPKRWDRPSLEPIRQLDTVNDGFHVSTFIEQIVENESQMEVLPLGSSRIMVWNIRLASSNPYYPSKWLMKNHLDIILPLT